MVFLKSVLAGIAGSILAVILLVVVMVAMTAAMNILRVEGMVGITMPIPIAVAALGFIVGFYLAYRNSN